MVTNKLKKLYCVFNDEACVEGIFDASGELLDYWYENDANWREEYFSGFMKKLGYKVERLYDGKALCKKLSKKLAEAVGE